MGVLQFAASFNERARRAIIFSQYPREPGFVSLLATRALLPSRRLVAVSRAGIFSGHKRPDNLVAKLAETIIFRDRCTLHTDYSDKPDFMIISARAESTRVGEFVNFNWNYASENQTRRIDCEAQRGQVN